MSRMDHLTAMQLLEAAGSEQTRKTYRRHGMPEPMFGVSYATLGVLKKQIKCDQGLAESLWATGNGDARTLATLIADADRLTPELLNGWAGDLRDHTMACALAGLASRTAHAHVCMTNWQASDAEMIGRAGWNILANLALAGALTNEELESYLPPIEERIHGEANRVKEGMHNALIAIGSSNDAIAPLAIAAARRIGTVEIDHGDTSCKTPDAEAYILKTRAYHVAKAAKQAKKAAEQPVKKQKK